MYDGRDKIRTQNPRETTNVLSLITFLFTWKLLRKGYKKDLTEDDIYEVPRKFGSIHLGNKLEQAWLKQQNTKNNTPSIYRVLWMCFGKYYMLLGSIQLTMRIIMVIFHPIAFSKFVSYFAANSKMSKNTAIFYACLVVGLNIINCTYNHNYMFRVTELGIRIKTGMCSLIYRKALKLKSSSLSNIGIGRLVTIISKDVASIEMAIVLLNDIWIALILLLLTSGIMYYRIGVSALAGSLFLVFIIPLQLYFGKLTTSLRLKASKMTDNRLQITQQSISASKLIKMHSWEQFFADKIMDARQSEMNKVRHIFWVKATSLVIGGLVLDLAYYIIVIVYTSLGNHFTAEMAYNISSCISMLRSTVTFIIPMGIVCTAELAASLRRITQVLTAQEHNDCGRKNTTEKPVVEMQDVEVKIEDKTILQNINLEIKPGLNFLVGKLGGGKSTLLKTILEDYAISSGQLKVKGSISYASEEPWLFPSSIKQNILFGQRWDNERYKKVLQVCALEMDISTFERGDETIVEDRGANLSTGQRARINLARAIYCDSDIYLLDDCLSSLDTRVQSYVFAEAIKMFLKHKIVIMISNNEELVKKANNVILIENGTVKECFKPTEDKIEEIVRETDELQADDIIDNIVKDVHNHEEENAPLLERKEPNNIYLEQKKKGKVLIGIYMKYFKFGGGILVMIPLLLLFVFAEVANTFNKRLIRNWVTIQQNISEYQFNMTNATAYEHLLKLNTRTLNVYSAVVVIAMALLLSRAYAHFYVGCKASIKLHAAMITSVINSTMKFFDHHYLGNILNRFSKDLATIDETLQLNLYECFSWFLKFFGSLILILSVRLSLIVPIISLCIILYVIRRFYVPTGRSLKRLDIATRSPMVGHINSTLEGLTTIRAYGTQMILRKEFDKHQDLYTSAFYMYQSSLRAFAYGIDILTNLLITAVVCRFIIPGKDTLPGDVGLAIQQALLLTGSVQFGIRQWTELEYYMTSTERAIEYSDIEKENRSGKVIERWPTSGKIAYQNVNLTYGKSKELVLKNITFSINGNEKIGIVGRTGAGKTSLISALFRLYQYTGSIKIDDVDITTLSLTFLRSNITIIPQNPTLFSGTLRTNIDPNGRYKDEELWKAIKTVGIKNLIPSLEDKITDGGSSFSAGQKQIICLVRAAISKTKIIILDEATANVDAETDEFMTKIIKENFADSTILRIAHRLHTVLNSDRVMVVDKGEIIEFDTTKNLLTNKNGTFYKMMKQANLL